MKNFREIIRRIITPLVATASALIIAMSGAHAQLPGDPDVVVATGSITLRSADGGRTWRTETVGAPASGGQPSLEYPGAVDARVSGDGLMRCRYRSASAAIVRLELADMSGAIVARADLGMIPAGEHEVELPIYHLAPGCYYCMIICGGSARGVKVLVPQ
jgi:hypothetical protein